MTHWVTLGPYVNLTVQAWNLDQYRRLFGADLGEDIFAFNLEQAQILVAANKQNNPVGNPQPLQQRRLEDSKNQHNHKGCWLTSYIKEAESWTDVHVSAAPRVCEICCCAGQRCVVAIQFFLLENAVEPTFCFAGCKNISLVMIWAHKPEDNKLAGACASRACNLCVARLAVLYYYYLN